MLHKSGLSMKNNITTCVQVRVKHEEQDHSFLMTLDAAQIKIRHKEQYCNFLLLR